VVERAVVEVVFVAAMVDRHVAAVRPVLVHVGLALVSLVVAHRANPFEARGSLWRRRGIRP